MKRVRAAGIIPYENGFMLMHRIKNVNGKEFEYYTIPGGGKEINETNEKCCIREIKEELGVEVEILKEVFSFEREGMLEYFYLCKYISGKFGTGDGPEFTESEEYKESGIYTPKIVKKEEIKNINLLPKEIREIIMKI